MRHIFLTACILVLSFLPFVSRAEINRSDDIPPEVIESVHEEVPDVIEEIVMKEQKNSFWNSPVTLSGVVFVTTFVLEEAAVAATAYLVASHRLNETLGFLSLYTGIFLSDLLLYAIGYFLARSRWLQGCVDIKYYQSQAQRYLERGLWIAITIARLVPGMLIPIFIILGMSRTDFKKVSAVNLIVTALYTFIALQALLKLGLQLSDLADVRTWLILGFVILAYLGRASIWNRIRGQFLIDKKNQSQWHSRTHAGMPSLTAPRSLTVFESLPLWITYAPVFLYMAILALRYRTVSALATINPNIENSGICGESKSAIYDSFPKVMRHFLPDYIVVEVRSTEQLPEVLMAMCEASLKFPIVAKPDIGYMSRGVELIENESALQAYLEIFPTGLKFILQSYVPGCGEAGVFYAAKPSEPDRPTISVALTYQPFVVGNGTSSLGDLIANDPRFLYFENQFFLPNLERVPADQEVVRLKLTGSASDGSIHIARPVPENSILCERIKAISRSLPDFWFGRFDVKFETVDHLLRGEFYVLELNGASCEDLTMWDPRNSIAKTYRIFARQIRLMFEIGLENKARGFQHASLFSILKSLAMQENLLFRLMMARSQRYRSIPASEAKRKSSIPLNPRIFDSFPFQGGPGDRKGP